MTTQKFWCSHAVLVAVALLMLCMVAVADDDVAIPVEKANELIAHARAQAEHGDAIAETQLGWLLALNPAPDAPRDYAEAARWFRRAADQDYPKAEVYLGTLYHQGLGVSKDEVEAFYWLEVGDGPKDLLAEVEKNMTPEQHAAGTARIAAKTWEIFKHIFPIWGCIFLVIFALGYGGYRLIRRAKTPKATAP